MAAPYGGRVHRPDEPTPALTPVPAPAGPAAEGAGRPARRTRWSLLLVGVLLLGANLRSAITAVGPVLGRIQAEAGLSGAEASLLVCLPLLAFAGVSPFAPRLAERFGLERTLGWALLVLAVGIVARSVPGPAMLWLGTLGVGAAIALMNVLIPSVVKRDHPRRIGPMTGLYQAVSSITAALASGLVVPVADVVPSGWRLALGLGAGVALIGVALFLPYLLPTRRARAAAAGPVPAAERARLPLWSATAWQVTAFMGLQSTFFYVMVTWLPAIQVGHGAGEVRAGWYHFGFLALALIGTVTAASLLPRTRDQRRLGAGITAVGVVGVLGLLLAPQLSLLWALAAGFCSGGAIVIAMALFGLRTANHHEAAGLSSMAQSVGYLFAAAGPVLVGALRDATGGWTVPLLATLAVLLLQGTAILFAGRGVLVPARPRP